MANERPVRVALLGAGTVGAAVARTLIAKREVYARQLGRPLEIAGILVKDKAKPRAGIESALLTTDASALLNDPLLDIVVEMLGVEDPSVEYMSSALANGKQVVTANKEVMAKHGAKLLAVARDRGVELLYEASVGGGIPIIAPLKRDLLANEITAVSAIINGTTNYILTAMSREGADFSDALKRAQDLGYAEPDPTNDIEAYDARYKLAILASLAFRAPVSADEIYREGITKLTAKDFRYAAELGYAIKLLAMARRQDGGVQTRVHPVLLPADAPLAKVDGVLNAIQVEGDLVGRVNFQGPGAGFPTVSAVVADVLDAAQGVIAGRKPAFAAQEAPTHLVPISELVTRYFVRITVVDQPGVLAQIAARLGEAQISIASVIQKEADAASKTAELVMMTHEAREASMQSALKAVAELDVVQEIGNFLRVEEQ
ncbi:MAG TPA: homoserine dehydrogenase [Dehalococcoidia bacterium]|nr:homoserine dehydrogenase [Dehalococcoidia bacterium]